MDTVSAFAGIAERVDAVRARIFAAAHRAGRDPHAITLIAVTKTVACDAIRTALAAGVRDFGENRVQELTAKVKELQADDSECRWHLIGHLQHNKVRRAVQVSSAIHSVDTRELAALIGSSAVDFAGPIDVFAQVNVSAEASKSGFAPSAFREAAADLATITGLRWRGLMTIAAEDAGPTELHETFAVLRRLMDDMRGTFSQHPWDSLSMGMTNDFEIAIEEGATHVRVGRAIFGDRATVPTGGPL